MLRSSPRPSSSNECGIVPTSVTSNVPGPGGTLAGVSWTFHSERLTLTVLGLGLPPARACAATRQSRPSATTRRRKGPGGPLMPRAGVRQDEAEQAERDDEEAEGTGEADHAASAAFQDDVHVVPPGRGWDDSHHPLRREEGRSYSRRRIPRRIGNKPRPRGVSPLRQRT